ncbi:DUF4430 domain-containing protein [Gracilibacillus oryzae]|uniref:DUF4430 domain-containing protein n=1 Tax=Gracilibacillus oryzae TaxID=1672701 RepID=A0A7C8GUE1_9BACI|nr:DUF4430 domain-containing protein [Gracilibacillus oryzae]KAB8138370.1 DUF4430 domain-containing protein [Gracilibacillus oryzae]
MKRFIITLITILMLAGCSGQDVAPDSTDTSGEGTVSITISINHQEEILANKELNIKETNNLMELLEANFEVEANDGLITSIEGYEQNIEKEIYWLYEVNGEQATVGASDYELSPGDKVVFDLGAFK